MFKKLLSQTKTIRNLKFYSTSVYHFGSLGERYKLKGEVKPNLMKIFEDKNIKQLACGDEHALALTETGEVYSWGSGTSGQLGHGSAETGSEPKLIELEEKIKFVACGAFNSALITESGELLTFGWGGRYQKSIPFGMGCLGNGQTTDILTPTKIDVNNEKLVSIAMGKRHAVAITETGNVYSWGKGEWGRLGNGGHSNQKTPYQIKPEYFVDTPIKTSCANNSSSILCQNGTVLMFGRNERLQLGIESTGNLIGGGQFDAVSEPTPLEVKDDKEIEVKFKDVAMGESVCCAVDIDNIGWMWGGTLLQPTKKEKLSNLKCVAAGSHHLCFISEEGKLFTMGSNWNGQLGVSGSTVQSQDIHEVEIPSKVIHAACGSKYTVVLAKNE